MTHPQSISLRGRTIFHKQDPLPSAAVDVAKIHIPDDVGVLQLTQHGDLSQRRAGDTVVLGLETDPLERHDLLGREVQRLVDHAVGALADGAALLDALVPVHAAAAARSRGLPLRFPPLGNAGTE